MWTKKKIHRSFLNPVFLVDPKSESVQACREAARCDELFSTSSPCTIYPSNHISISPGEEKGLGMEEWCITSLSSQAPELVRRRGDTSLAPKRSVASDAAEVSETCIV